jgi:alpha-glucan,water dikinase
VLPGDYAFVLHTAHPLSGAKGQVYGEVVAGLGETLVGNYPGRPLAFSDTPDGDTPQLISLPSKRTGLWSPEGGSLVARSDTNGEDLEGYAGAGLYDSIPVVRWQEKLVDYASEPIMWDGTFRSQLLDGLVELGLAVEDAFGGEPQDIEGVWVGGHLAVVQSRPQVITAAPAAPAGCEVPKGGKVPGMSQR